ncbi:MAG TPA: hypothetical protein DER09_14635 [Prolixibacteraceae bacterium]|nr:hypothetical protein [Prolixibacteraceae bacterium]
MEHVKIDFQRMQADYFLKYDYKFDETALAMLYILKKEQEANFGLQNSALYKAIDKIEDSQRTLALDREHPRWQAFSYGLGRFGLPLLLAICFVAIFYMIHLSNQQHKIIDTAKLRWYENFYQSNIENRETRAMKEYLRANPIPE